VSTTPELSIVIPVLDWDLAPLLAQLAGEIEAAGLAAQVEIVVADDGSRSRVRAANREAAARHPFIRYGELTERAGRAGIRNHLLARARGRYVLFLDADVLPDRPTFIRDYFREIARGQRVVCGGISYATRVLTDRKYDFYVYKGSRTEWLPADRRQQAPWRYLFTANVLIRRDVLDRIGFDAKNFRGYGYEDIEWAIRIGRQVTIRHIDNPCSHLGLVDRETAFARMRSSMENYMQLARLHPEEFRHTGVFRLVTLLRRLPSPLLGTMDRLLERLFVLSPANSLCYLLFQLDKAVLLASLERGVTIRPAGTGS